MNRRKFLKFLGKAVGASGVAIATGLPEAVEIVDDPNIPIEFEDSRSKTVATTVAWNGRGQTWKQNPDTGEWIETTGWKPVYFENANNKDKFSYDVLVEG